MTRASTAEPEAPARRRTKLALGAVAVVTVLVLDFGDHEPPFSSGGIPPATASPG
jgi:hypothetical protein